MNQISCKVFITKCCDPYKNLAAEEMLMRYIQPGTVILYLWQNENTIVIGRNQNAWRECKLEAFRAQQGKLARRLSGGGAVYHDMGNQNFTFMAYNELYDVAKQIEVICQATRKFGIQAIRNGRNDITAEGKKFSGNAFYSTKKVSYHHGTILLSSDMVKLNEFLTPSKAKMKAKGIKSVQTSVINLCELAPMITPRKMRNALLTSFAEVYSVELEYLKDNIFDLHEWERLAEHYSSHKWTLGKLSDFDQHIKTKLSFGEIELQLSVSNGIIQNVVMYSDAINANWVKAVKTKMIGSAFKFDEINMRLSVLEMDRENTEELLCYLKSAELVLE